MPEGGAFKGVAHWRSCTAGVQLEAKLAARRDREANPLKKLLQSEREIPAKDADRIVRAILRSHRSHGFHWTSAASLNFSVSLLPGKNARPLRTNSAVGTYAARQLVSSLPIL